MNSNPQLNTGPVSIIGGPSKFDLMLALFDNQAPHGRTVIFHLEEDLDERLGKGRTERRFTATIDAVQAEDGSAESWNFKGKGHYHVNGVKFAVEGYYSTKRRRGHIRSMMVSSFPACKFDAASAGSILNDSQVKEES